MLSSQPQKRRRGAWRIGKLILIDSRERRTAYTNGGDLNSLIIWQDLRQPYAASTLQAWWLNLSWCWSGCLSALRPLRHKIEEVDEAVKALHLHADIYLSLLFVSEDHRGQGIVRQLISPLLDKCDTHQLRCAVDTFNHSNVAMYRHFGFKLVGQTRLTGGVINYQMLRMPSKKLNSN